MGCLCLSLLISPLAVAIADLNQLMPIALQIGFLSAPILFFKPSLGAFGWIANLNPLYGWVQLARDPFLGTPHWGWQWLALVLQLLVAALLLLRLERQRMRIVRWL
jgi:ABC-type polysaccharide/polyol phosphate export permease